MERIDLSAIALFNKKLVVFRAFDLLRLLLLWLFCLAPWIFLPLPSDWCKKRHFASHFESELSKCISVRSQLSDPHYNYPHSQQFLMSSSEPSMQSSSPSHSFDTLIHCPPLRHLYSPSLQGAVDTIGRLYS